MNPIPPLPQSSGYQKTKEVSELRVSGNINLGKENTSGSNTSTGIYKSLDPTLSYGVLTGYLVKEPNAAIFDGDYLYLTNSPDVVSPKRVNTSLGIPFPDNIIYLPAGATVTGIVMNTITSQIAVSDTDTGIQVSKQDFNSALSYDVFAPPPSSTLITHINKDPSGGGTGISKRGSGVYLKKTASTVNAGLNNLPPDPRGCLLKRAQRITASGATGLRPNIAAGQPEDNALLVSLTGGNILSGNDEALIQFKIEYTRSHSLDEGILL